jgi:addiction module HigA family antidote
MAKRLIPLATPGEILLEEFLKPLGVTQYRLAKGIGVPQRRIGDIVASKRSLTADTAARWGVFFGMEAEFWLNLPAHYDLAITREALAENFAAMQPLEAAA